MSLKEWFSIVREAEEPPANRSSVDPASEPHSLLRPDFCFSIMGTSCRTSRPTSVQAFGLGLLQYSPHFAPLVRLAFVPHVTSHDTVRGVLVPR